MDNQSLLLIQPLEVSDVLNVGVSSRLVYEGSPCDAFPCWNGGTCVELRRKKDPPIIKKRTVNRGNHSKGYLCKCGPFFTGQHCQQRRLQVQSPIDEEKNCVHRNCDDSGTGCLPQQLGSQCLPPVEQKAARTLAMDFDKQISEGDQQQHQQQCPPTAQQCLNGGLCIRLGTAPGHLECICPAQFAGSHCQFSSTTTAPLLLPGLLLLSLLLFLLSMILLLFHNSTAGGFFFLHLPRRTRGAGKSSFRRRNCPPLLQWSNNQQLEEEEERGLTGHDFGGFNDGAEPGANMELRERPAGTTGGGIGFCALSRGPAGPFSLRSAVVQFQSDTAKQEKAGGGGFEPSKVVHI